MHGIIPDIGLALLAAAGIGFIFHLLRQPLILSYIVAGAIIGPEMGFKLVFEPENIKVISEIGLILLLFIIGLELNPNKLRSAGKEFIYAGVGQFLLCLILGLGFFLLIGHPYTRIDSLYLSIFCALSSTAVVVKLLFDKFELDTLAGRLTLGILIFQDIWAIMILAIQPNFMNPRLYVIGLALGKSILLLLIGFLLSKYLLKWIMQKIAKMPEMVVAMAIAWCALMAGLSSYIGLSMEMGALIAGAAISSFPFGVHIVAKVLPLRDFFLTLFFLSIGMRIPVPDLSMFWMVIVIVAFIVFSRFTTIYPVLSWAGRGPRTSFIVSLNLSQISEFSLVIAALGVDYGHIGTDLLSLITYAMALTAVLSSYFISSNHQIFLLFDKLLGLLGFRSLSAEEKQRRDNESYPIVLLGCHRAGMLFLDKIVKSFPLLLGKILVIDFNLEILKQVSEKGIQSVFGDISSLDTLEHAHVGQSAIILSTIPDMLLRGTSNESILRTCRILAPEASIVVTAESSQQVEKLKMLGADKVLYPYELISDQIIEYIL
jgi:Kef-type K+ transport system membrane component KefB